MKKTELENEIKLLLEDVIFKSGLYISKSVVSPSFFSDCGLLTARIYSLIGKVTNSEHDEMGGTLEQSEFVSIIVSKSQLFLLPESKTDYSDDSIGDSEINFRQSFGSVFDIKNLTDAEKSGFSNAEKRAVWNAENMKISEPPLPEGGKWMPEDFDVDAFFESRKEDRE